MSDFLKRINEIIKATEQEMLAAKQNNRDCQRNLSSGERTGSVGETFLYSFNCDKSLPEAEEIIADIRIEGKRTSCDIVRATEKTIEISVGHDLGEKIEKAKLCWETISLLEKLKGELSLLTDDDALRFKISEEVFRGISRTLKCNSQQPSFRKDEHAPNSSQLNAICKSFQNSLAIIWGPPGSGKTRTIARAVEAHLKEGRRVLLVSHANSAVDQLLRGVAEQLSDNYYARGEVIRLGQTQDIELIRDFPLIDPEAIANEQQRLIDEEVSVLERNKEELLKYVETLENCKGLEKEIASEFELMQQISDRASLIEKRARELLKEMCQLNETLSLLDVSPSSGVSTSCPPDSRAMQLCKELSDEIATRNYSLDQLRGEHNLLSAAYLKAEDKCTELARQINEATKENSSKKFSIDASIELTKKEIGTIDTSISGLRSKNNSHNSREIISKARVVACTLFKTVSAAKSIGDFDIVILDEASMAPQPYLYWACSLAKLGVTVCGDFKQLPPVAQSTSQPGIAWYVQSIFDRLGVLSVKDALADSRVALLDTQYRMTPQIGDLSNNLFYDGKLKNAPSTASLKFEDSLSGAYPLILVDTSEVGAFCQRIDGEGRFNMYESILSQYILSKIAQDDRSVSVGVCSPYKLQARIVGELCRQLQCKDFCSDTVHKYQGRERDVMIFTCADSQGVSNAAMLEKDRDAEILLNVALTRARKKVYFIANVQFYRKLGADKIINQVIDYVFANGLVICASKLDLTPREAHVEGLLDNIEDRKLAVRLEKTGVKLYCPIPDHSFKDQIAVRSSDSWTKVDHRSATLAEYSRGQGM